MSEIASATTSATPSVKAIGTVTHSTYSVMGDGWAALSAVTLLAVAGKEVTWIIGTETHPLSPLGTLEQGPGVEHWARLGALLGLEFGTPQEGSYSREFRNKAFREPSWLKGGDPLHQIKSRDQALWLPERRLAPLNQVRYPYSLAEMEQAVRRKLKFHDFKNLKRMEGVPVQAFEFFEQAGRATVRIHLGSGDKIESEHVVYADRWSLLHEVNGLPRPLTLLRKREPVGMLQASFKHRDPICAGVVENFYIPMARESGEETERNLWGYFTSDGMQSIWTVCLTSEEGDDNHTIAKKLRKLKATLDKVFEITGWVPAEKGKFTTLLTEEQVRFEEESLYSMGEIIREPILLPEAPGILFLTDGYGPGWALTQSFNALSPLLVESAA